MKPAVCKCKIEKGIPIPPIQTRYPLSDMAKGDSFMLPVKTKDFHNVYACAKRKGITVSVRKVQNGFRVWRVK